MGEGPSERYPRGWVSAGGPPRGARWAARHPVLFAVLLAMGSGVLAIALVSLLLAPVPATAVGATIGVLLGGVSLVAQRDLRALLDRWDDEHRID